MMIWAKRKCKIRLSAAMILLLVFSVAALLPIFSTALQSQTQPPNSIPGQSATLLSDGRWLLLGGESFGNGLDAATIWNPQTGATTELTTRLKHARAWHSATTLPDGTVFIFGGTGPDKQIVQTAELFDPMTISFSEIGSSLSARSRHTATLLTDGQVLIAGGTDSRGQMLVTADLWDPTNDSVARVLDLPRLAAITLLLCCPTEVFCCGAE